MIDGASDNMLKVQSMRERLAESEEMLYKATALADSAYASLSAGDLEKCQLMIGELIHSISEHFYEEVH